MLGGVALPGERLTPQVALGGLIAVAGVAFILVERTPAPAPALDAAPPGGD